MAPDPVATAVATVAKAEAAPAPVSVRLRLSSGRVVALVVPVDLTAHEVIDLVAFATSGSGLPAELAKRRRGPASRIIVPRV